MIKFDKLKDFLVNNWTVILIFAVFFVLIYIQQQFLWLYHDDYGYASLSYAYVVDGVEGTNFNFSQLMEFLKGHYNVWGGRILGFFFEIVLLSKGIWLYRLVQAIMITGIYFMIFKIIKKICGNNVIKDWILALISVICYGFFEIMLVRSGIFWITASVLYIFPIFPLLIFIYWYNDGKKKEFKNIFTKSLFYVLNGIFIFIATFSQEQIAIAALSYILVLTFYNIINSKKISKMDITMSIISIIAFSILMFAPGNALRQLHPTSSDFYSKSFFERIFLGLEGTILGDFSLYTRIFTILFFVSAAVLSYVNIIEKKGNKILNIISSVSIFSVLIFTLVKAEGYFSYIYYLLPFNIYRKCMIVFFILQLALIVYSVFVHLYCKKELKIINILISAIVSQGCMIIAPYFALRSAIIFEVLCYILIIYTFVEVFKRLENKKVLTYILIPLVLLSVINFLIISIGYYKNSVVNEQNNIALINASNALKNGEDIKEVTLKKLPNILYSGDQPYNKENEYIKVYMREYYNLPVDFEFNYE